MKKNYEVPEIEFIQLNILDIIATSTQESTQDTEGLGDGGNDD
jgi:hypothetical protein